jgi:hypothetical protein
VLRLPEDRGDVKAIALAGADNGLLHALDRVLSEQLQDANELAGARLQAILLFQGRTQIAEYCRQLPLSVHVGVIECRRLTTQRHEIMQRIKDLHSLPIGPRVVSDDLAAGNDIDMMHVGFDGHRLKSKSTGYAVAIPIEAHCLVLIHLGGLPDRRVEWLCG